MVFQAYIDDSVSDSCSVFSGHVASAEAWANFSREWEEMLPYSSMDKDGNFNFKMSQMAANPERMERVRAFYKIIAKHVSVSLSCFIKHQDCVSAQNKILIDDGISFKYEGDYFDLLFQGLLRTLHETRDVIHSVVPSQEPVDFIFDNTSKKRRVLDNWDGWIESMKPEIRKRFGSTPRFEDDSKFLPLQAADFWAWWVREGCEAGEHDRIEKLFPIRNNYSLYVWLTEEQLLEFFCLKIREQHGDRRIIDKKTGRSL